MILTIPADSSVAFWLACIAVGFGAASLYIWARHRGKQVWTRFGTRERILVRCFAIAALWCVLAFVEHDRLEASWMTAVVALFWGAYALFSRTVDRFWARMRRH